MSTGGVGTISGSDNTTFADISQNTLDGSTSVLSGPVYCIQAYGGYSTTQSFDTVQRLSETIIGRYDVTGAVEVLMDVRLFNAKIGITKDASNIGVTVPTSTYYSDVSNMLLTDSLTISAQEFIQDISNAGAGNSIVSVGLLSTIYSDFSNYVATYFGMPNQPTSATNPNEYGFATLFANDPNFNPNAGVFNPAAFYDLLTKAADAGWSDGSGAQITTLSGTVTVSNITSLLRNAVDANPFGNRNSQTGTTASDPYDRSNYGVTDGFFADDLFFIPANGFQITLKLGIDSEAFLTPLNNAGSTFMNTTNTATAGGAYSSGIDVSGVTDTSFNANSTTQSQQIAGASTTNTTFVSQTSVSTTLIQRVVQAPLLIRLMNYSLA